MSTINLPEKYTVREYSEPFTGMYDGSLLYYYIIEWDHFSISFFASEHWEGYIRSAITFEINDNNYLYLFPFIDFYEISGDTSFGRLAWFSRHHMTNVMIYEIRFDDDDPKNFCYLEFNN